MTLLSWINRGLDLASVIALTLASIILAVMLGINGFNIIWRGLFDQAFSWVFPWTMLLFAWMILFGLYAFIRDNRDVVVDVIVVRLPYALRLIIALAIDAIGIILFATTFIGAGELMQFQVGQMDMIDLPRDVRTFPILISSGLLVVHFLAHAIGLLTGYDRPLQSRR